jgi:hypothetical protein
MVIFAITEKRRMAGSASLGFCGLRFSAEQLGAAADEEPEDARPSRTRALHFNSKTHHRHYVLSRTQVLLFSFA